MAETLMRAGYRSQLDDEVGNKLNCHCSGRVSSHAHLHVCLDVPQLPGKARLLPAISLQGYQG